MTSPMSLTTTGSKSLAIFVHGINADYTSWDDLFKLMGEDPAMTSAFDWLPFKYQSKVFRGLLDIRSRIPDYDDITQELDQFITIEFTSTYKQLFLVGHSQGGLIIQSWLAKVLSENRGESLKSVREILFICTPTLGSDLASPLRKIVFSFIRDPQEERLRVLNSDVAKTRRFVEERVVQTYTRDATHCPVPIVSIWGAEDNIVTAAAAQASFDSILVMDGHHSSVLKPEDRNDTRYKLITSALLQPYGHRHVFEIDRYETSIAVEPLANPNYIAHIGGQEIARTSDNFARITRTVSFSDRNRCTDLFHFNYQTNKDGFLKPRFDLLNRELDESPPPNEAATDESGRWEKGGTDTTYDFRPAPGRTYAHTVDIWKGFDQGNRDVHFHFGPNVRCREYVFTVDLTAYVAAGWTVNQKPQLYRNPSATLEHDIREKREPQNLIPGCEEDASGKWTWTLQDFRGGIVDAVWDVVAPGASTS
jgi:pimeloyl-ACP methyl ester carboxylesterase